MGDLGVAAGAGSNSQPLPAPSGPQTAESGGSNTPAGPERVIACTSSACRISPGPGGEQEVLATILSYLPETVNILDRDLRYVHVDREFARKLGREPREMVGKTWEELGFSMEGAGTYFERVREVFATGRGVRGEVRHAVVRDIKLQAGPSLQSDSRPIRAGSSGSWRRGLSRHHRPQKGGAGTGAQARAAADDRRYDPGDDRDL